MSSALERRLAALEERVEALEAGRRTRTGNECRKGNDPDSCSAASPYHYQQGCSGAACRVVNTEYYSPAAKRARKAAKETPVAVKRKGKTWRG